MYSFQMVTDNMAISSAGTTLKVPTAVPTVHPRAAAQRGCSGRSLSQLLVQFVPVRDTSLGHVAVLGDLAA